MGYAALLLAESTRYMRTEPNYQFGMLFCDPKRISYYKKCGYDQISNQVYVRRGNERHLFPDPCMALELWEFPFPIGEVDCMGLPW